MSAFFGIWLAFPLGLCLFRILSFIWFNPRLVSTLFFLISSSISSHICFIFSIGFRNSLMYLNVHLNDFIPCVVVLAQLNYYCADAGYSNYKKKLPYG